MARREPAPARARKDVQTNRSRAGSPILPSGLGGSSLRARFDGLQSSTPRRSRRAIHRLRQPGTRYATSGSPCQQSAAESQPHGPHANGGAGLRAGMAPWRAVRGPYPDWRSGPGGPVPQAEATDFRPMPPIGAGVVLIFSSTGRTRRSAVKERVQRQGFGLPGSLLLLAAFVLLWHISRSCRTAFGGSSSVLWPYWLAAAVANLLLSRLAPLGGLGGGPGHSWRAPYFGAWWVAEGGERPPVLPVDSPSRSRCR